ncbi:MAG: flagellar export chaperone FlgN [Bacillota bacterium]|nr:flagellar export chaperone FlgN [Bacillota bacterium]
MELSLLRYLLAEEVKILEEIRTSEEDTSIILIEGDTSALESINKQREVLVLKLQELEQQRAGLLPSGFTLKEYVDSFKPSCAAELLDLRRRLLQLHSSLQRRQKINRHLIKHNMQFIHSALKYLFPGRDGEFYAQSGQVKINNSFSSGLLDSNA